MATVDYGGVRFARITLEDCLPLAQRLQAAGGGWHSHVLSPGCRHNPFPDHYAVVIEDDGAAIAHIAEGTQAFPEVDKALVKMLHGDDILDASALTGAGGDCALLHQLQDVQAQGVAWHHHMHFPDCVFNPHPGDWSIAVETPTGAFSEAFPAEPVDVLRAVEVLYFGNLAARESEAGESEARE